MKSKMMRCVSTTTTTTTAAATITIVVLAFLSGCQPAASAAASKCHLDLPQDVVIILDSSTSIARADFSKQLHFVKDFVNQFKIGPDASQVGVISFSNSEVLNFHLNRYKTKAELQDAILKIKQIGGGTNTHKPLEYMRTKMFVPAGGDRPGVRNLGIVITDGQSSNPVETTRQAVLARNAGIELHALGVGPGVTITELNAIAGDAERSYAAQDFNTLNTIIEQFKKTQECPFTAPGDPVITKSPQGPVAAGDKVKLKCASEGTDGDTTLAWSKDRAPVSGTASKNGTHHISEVDYTASGAGADFTCHVQHPKMNAPLNSTARVDVLPGPPVITGTPTDAVKKGTPVKLTASSVGTDPRTSLTWHKNGIEVGSSQSVEGDKVVNSYEFATGDDTASAKFEARVSHPLLQRPLTAETKLDTFVLPGSPIIQGTPADAVANGTRVTLRASSLGTDPQTKLVWYKDGQEVDGTHAIQPPNVVNEYTFATDGSQPTHIFEARVTHPRLQQPLTNITEVHTYVLPGPPVITGAPNDAIAVGSRVKLTATSAGTDPNTQLLWYQNGQQIDDTHNIQAANVVNDYEFSADETNGNAVYEARVTHPRLRTPLKSEVKLSTFELPRPPVITGTPTDAVEHGTPVTLRATSLGTDRDTQLVWYQDGKEVDRTYAVQPPNVVNEHTFMADGTKPKSTFEARVTHPRLRTPLSASATVDTYTLPRPPVITGTPADAVEQGTPVTVRATSLGTDRDTQLVWYQDGKEVDRTYAVQPPNVVNEHTFTADGSKPTSTLEARVTHPRLRTPLSASTTVGTYVLPRPPVITGTPTDAVEHGTPVTLRATSLGTDPDTQLVWYQDGRELDRTYAVQPPNVVNEHTFTADHNKPRSTFEARVTHPRLRTPLSASTSVDVYALPGPPVITGAPRDAVEHGTPVTLRATSAGSDPKTQIVWYQDDKEIDRTYAVQGPNVVNEHTFTADSSKPKATYEARVLHPRLPAPLRASAPVETYALPGPPVITGAPADAVQHGTPVTLRADSLGTDPNTQVTWYRDGKEVDRTYAVKAPHVTNEYAFVADSKTPLTNLEARVSHPRLREPLTKSIEVETYVLPGPPQISGSPEEAILPGQRVSLLARSLGTDPNTRLVWYRNGVPVDSTYESSGSHVVNRYDFVAGPGDDQAVFEAKVHHPRIPAALVADTDIKVAQEKPGQPVITGLPKEPVEKDTRIQLQCRSAPAVNGTRLAWYKDGVLVDDLFSLTSEATVNDYSFTTGPAGSQLECRATHPILDGPLVANGNVAVTDCNLRSRELDVAFLVDSSSSIYEPDFRTIMNFLSSLVEVFNVGPSKHRIGAAIFSDRPYKAFLLNDFGNLDQVQRALRGIRKVLGSTHTDRAISYLHNRLLLPISGARVGVPKVAFIVTDGHSYDPQKTAEEAKKLRQGGVTTYAIAIGSNADHDELLAIAGRQQGVFKGSFNDLPKMKADIQSLVRQCRLLQPPDPVDGGWTSWEPSGPCSVTCGEGMRTMIRECSSPPPSNGGKPCSGATSMTQKCRSPVQCHQCMASADTGARGEELDAEDSGNDYHDVNGGSKGSNGGWSGWLYETPCSITCGGGGLQSISRTCLSPYGDCQEGQVESKMVACYSKPCAPIFDACGGQQGVDVLLITNGHSDRILSLVRNVTAALPVDGRRVRLSVVLPDCECRPATRSRHRGFTLRQYSHTGDVLRHLDSLISESRPTLAAIIRRAREDNGIVPSLEGTVGTPYDSYANGGSTASRRVVVIVVDNEDVSGEAVSECQQLKMAGYDVLGISVGGSNRGLELLVTEPVSRHYLRAETGDTASYIRKEICRDTYRK